MAAVPVRGGLLSYEVLAGETEPALAIHGISSQRRLWNWLPAEAPELTLIAPDLRGRADSLAISGPFSLAQHVEDMIMILDQLEIDSVHICGMSMGGFVAMRLAPVDTRLLPEADHAATIMTHRGAAIVAEMIKAALRHAS